MNFHPIIWGVLLLFGHQIFNSMQRHLYEMRQTNGNRYREIVSRWFAHIFTVLDICILIAFCYWVRTQVKVLP